MSVLCVYKGVTLYWDILQDPSQYELISTFQLCYYQELGGAPFSSDLLKLVGYRRVLPQSV